MSGIQFYPTKPINDLHGTINMLPGESSQGVQWLAQYYTVNGNKLKCDEVERSVALVNIEKDYLDMHKGSNIELSVGGPIALRGVLRKLNWKPAKITTLLGFIMQHLDVLRAIPPREDKDLFTGKTIKRQPDLWAGESMIAIPWNIRPEYTKSHLSIFGQWSTLSVSTGKKPALFSHELHFDISLWNRLFLVERP